MGSFSPFLRIQTILEITVDSSLGEQRGYSSALRSRSQGRDSCSMQPSTYAAAPDEVLKRFL